MSLFKKIDLYMDFAAVSAHSPPRFLFGMV